MSARNANLFWKITSETCASVLFPVRFREIQQPLDPGSAHTTRINMSPSDRQRRSVKQQRFIFSLQIWTRFSEESSNYSTNWYVVDDFLNPAFPWSIVKHRLSYFHFLSAIASPYLMQCTAVTLGFLCLTNSKNQDRVSSIASAPPVQTLLSWCESGSRKYSIRFRTSVDIVAVSNGRQNINYRQ